MRKLLIVTVLFLFLTAITASNQTTKADVAPVGGADCTAARVTVTSLQAVVNVTCANGSSQECQAARNELFSAQLVMISACYT